MLEDLYENNSYGVLKKTTADRIASCMERMHEKESVKNLLLYRGQLKKKKKL